jgi:hypothetical protein
VFKGLAEEASNIHNVDVSHRHAEIDPQKCSGHDQGDAEELTGPQT